MENIKRAFRYIPITSIVISLCIIVYFVSLIKYGLTMDGYQGIDFGGYFPMLVHFNHEYYRLISANFIHFGLFHLVVNCVSFYQVGLIVERSFSRNKYLLLIIGTMLATTGLPYLLFLLNGFNAYSVSGGLSGVVFGMVGAIGALALRHQSIYRDIWRVLLPQLLLMLGLSFVVPTISLSGHIAGLIGGFVLTMLLTGKKRIIN